MGLQGIFFNLYSLFYLMSPRHCHAFVGYLEEEAVKTYTHCLADIDQVRPELLLLACPAMPEAPEDTLLQTACSWKDIMHSRPKGTLSRPARLPAVHACHKLLHRQHTSCCACEGFQSL